MHLMISSLLERVRTTQPLVHNITNQVVMNSTANALLAIGASPIIAHAPEEISDMVALSGSLVINSGTLTSQTLVSMITAAKAANTLNKPWVLDPVGVGATPFRLHSNQQLLKLRPSIIRGNASEITTLLNNETSGKGVDSSSSSEATLSFLQTKAKEHQLTLVVTGKIDLITDGDRLAKISNGHPMMARVTGTGCTATALTGAFLAVGDSHWEAGVAAIACLGIAGELAAQVSNGPGSLQVQLLDHLYKLDNIIIDRHLAFEI